MAKSDTFTNPGSPSDQLAARGPAYCVIRTREIKGIVRHLKKGVAISRYDAFVRKSALAAAYINAVVGLPPRTLVRRRKAGRLSPVESERLYRLSVIFEHAVALHEENVDDARTWMSTPKLALSGQTPMEMCETEVGAREVENLIGRLEHGVFS